MVTRNHARSRALTLNDASGVSPYSIEEAWALTGVLSPREIVRVAARASTGEVLNTYDRVWPVVEGPPSTTWAMLLTDEDLRFQYLCFDFDTSNGNAVRDADRMSYWLRELNIPHLLCVSGPSGGRHIWVRLGEPADAVNVRDLATLTKQILPSLDIQPLTNARAGCVRPPYAPHRVSGFSNPQGDLRAITEQQADAGAVEALSALFADMGAALPVPDTTLPHGVVTSDDGQPRLKGAKRPLSLAMDAALHGEAGSDASYTLARVLAACANARWAYRDITALLDSSPSLEHARTRRVGAKRLPRSQADTDKVLTGMWRHAVTYVASNPLVANGDDPDYRDRMKTVTATVERALSRADALPGLWATRNSRVEGTHSQRVVLDALCLYMLQSAREVVEADVRRLAAETGYGRTTVHTALRSLAAGAWIERVGVAEGVNGQRYRLSEKFSTEESISDWTQARMRADPETHALHLSLSLAIATRLELLTHDVFCAPGGVGRTSGLIFKGLREESASTLQDLVRFTGITPATIRERLYDLVRSGLVERTAGGWRRHSPTARDFAARRLGVDGYLALRRERYDEERLVWAWWLAELAWMRKKGKHRRGKKSTMFGGPDRQDYAAYPRSTDARGDHAKALELVRAGYLQRGFVMAA